MRRILLSLLFLFSFATSASADYTTYPYSVCQGGVMAPLSGYGICTGPASAYNITIEQITMVKSDGSKINVLTETWREDLAAVPENATVGDVAQNVELPLGTYTGVILTLNRTITGLASTLQTTDGYSCSGSFSSDLNFDGTSFSSLPVCGANDPNGSLTDCRSGDSAKYYYDIDLTYDGTPISYEFVVNTSQAAQCQFGGTTTGVPQLGILEVMVDGDYL